MLGHSSIDPQRRLDDNGQGDCNSNDDTEEVKSEEVGTSVSDSNRLGEKEAPQCEQVCSVSEPKEHFGQSKVEVNSIKRSCWFCRL